MRDDLVTILFSIAKTDVTVSRQITEPNPVHPVPLTINASSSSSLRCAHSRRDSTSFLPIRLTNFTREAYFERRIRLNFFWKRAIR